MKKLMAIIFILISLIGYSQIVINPYVFNNLKSGLLSVWELDETSAGNAVDSYAGKNFTTINATINQTGKIGTSYLFDGSTSYLKETPSPNNYHNPSDMSISAWVYRIGNSSTGDEGTIFNLIDTDNNNTIYSLYVYDSDHDTYPDLWGIRYRNAAGNFYTFSLSEQGLTWNNSWVHLMITRTGTTLTTYINGISTNPVGIASGGTTSATSADILMGTRGGASTTYHFNGRIDQVAIWNRVLTGAEAALVYSGGSGLAYGSW